MSELVSDPINPLSAATDLLVISHGAFLNGLQPWLSRKQKSGWQPLAVNVDDVYRFYGTGAPVGFADRPEIEGILDRAKPSDYGVRTLIIELIQSPLFRNK